MKHVTIYLVTLLSCFTALSAQVKKTYQDKNHKHQTVVIKTSDSDNDLDILNAQFNIDDFKVGDQVKITTTNTVEVDRKKPIKESIKTNRIVKFKKNHSKKNKFSGRSLGGKRKDKKPSLVFNDPPKRKRGKDYSKKCYKFK